MRARLANTWEYLNNSFWFLPAVMAALACALAFATVAVDERTDVDVSIGTLVGTPSGARQLLGTIAGSAITTAGVVFSITIVVLGQASTQYGPRLLRNFIADRSIQFVLGTFVANFLYSLLVLRTVRGVEESEFVPELSVTVAVILAVCSVAVLIFYIHHVASAIQATNVIMSCARELDDTIARVFPKQQTATRTEAQPAAGVALAPAGLPLEVLASTSGYLQSMQMEDLLHIARSHDLTMRFTRHPGSFVTEGGVIAEVWPGDRVPEGVPSAIKQALQVGATRTPRQDIEYAVDQMVEIAVRALSPGVNDPFTAMTCIDRLGAALTRMVTLEFPSPHVYDEDQRLRLLTQPVQFKDVLDSAFNQIRQNSRGAAAVTIRLMEAIITIAGRAQREEDREALLRHAEMIMRTADDIPEQYDRADVHRRYERALEVIREHRTMPIA